MIGSCFLTFVKSSFEVNLTFIKFYYWYKLVQILLFYHYLQIGEFGENTYVNEKKLLLTRTLVSG